MTNINALVYEALTTVPVVDPLNIPVSKINNIDQVNKKSHLSDPLENSPVNDEINRKTIKYQSGQNLSPEQNMKSNILSKLIDKK